MSLPATIKALQTQQDRSVKVIEIPFANQEKVKNLSPHEIIVKVRAIGINPTDWKHSIVDLWGDAGNIVGCDAAGDVVKVGSAVKHVKVGDRVFAFGHGCAEDDNGAYAEYARFRAEAAFVLPPGMSYAEAASFPIPHLTAVQALYFRLGLPKPTTSPSHQGNFLVWGGSSAVGHHAVQLAKLSGYRVVTTASKANHEYLKSIGADVTIDYKDPDVLDQIKAATKDGGLKLALDVVCEKGSTDVCVDAITAPEGGHIVTTLPPSPETQSRRPNVKVEFTLVYTLVKPVPFVFGKVADIPYIEEDHVKSVEWVTQDLPKLVEGWEEGKGSPRYKAQRLRVDRGLDKIGEGLHYMKDGKVKAEKLIYIVA